MYGWKVDSNSWYASGHRLKLELTSLSWLIKIYWTVHWMNIIIQNDDYWFFISNIDLYTYFLNVLFNTVKHGNSNFTYTETYWYKSLPQANYLVLSYNCTNHWQHAQLSTENTQKCINVSCIFIFIHSRKKIILKLNLYIDFELLRYPSISCSFSSKFNYLCKQWSNCACKS